MTKHKKKHSQTKPVPLALLGVTGLALCIVMLLQGTDIVLFHPKGLIAGQERSLLLLTVAIFMLVAAPTLALLYFTAWKYRESNNHAVYAPGAHHSKFFVFGMWAIPIVFMLVMASVLWPAAHRLQPQKPLSSSVKPLAIQVVAMRWKWLFIYPEQHIATVNFIQVPLNTPLQFDLTADEAPMSSFWIPHLGGQLYAMTGHVNRLNLMANVVGDYQGSSAEINGAGFAGMKFIARADTKNAFDQWVQGVKQSSTVLDAEGYQKLLSPSQNNTSAFYSQADSDLYPNLLLKYNGSHNHNLAENK
jgi:cytochrome o ubiquinol oxidase subunit 2